MIVDLGYGTGLELAWILQKAPNAEIIGIDLSESMTAVLLDHYREKRSQIKILYGSYLKVPIPGNIDFVISSQSIHHLDKPTKLSLYKKIFKALKPKGSYIEGDYAISEEEERQSDVSSKSFPLDGSYHIDIPFSVNTLLGLSSQAGFSEMNVLFYNHQCSVIQSKR